MENVNLVIITTPIMIIAMFINSWWNRKMLKKYTNQEKNKNKSLKSLNWTIVNGFLILTVVLFMVNLTLDLINESLSKYLIFSVSFSLTNIYIITNIVFDRFKTSIYIEMFENLSKGIDENSIQIKKISKS